MITEVCIGSVPCAYESFLGGAQRVELCDNLVEGGTTPSQGAIIECKKIKGLKTMVMIRPRGGDFLYSDVEFEIMKEDVKAARNLGADGVVFGILTKDGSMDIQRLKQLIDLAGEMEVTNHRAFDMCNDPFLALEQLIDLGVKRILTSGQHRNVWEGRFLIADLVKKAAGRIIIMPGAGVKEDNIVDLMAITKAPEYHVALTKKIPSQMEYRNEKAFMGSDAQPEFEHLRIDSERIRTFVNLVNQHQ